MAKEPKAPFPGVLALTNFIKAREEHRLAKEAETRPRNPDPIISDYRFCNVRRNDDRVTKWVHEQYMARWKDDPALWFALVVARLFNNEETLGDIMEFVLPLKADPMRRRLKVRAALGKKNFNAAYIVSTAGQRMDKIDYVVDHILLPMWKGGGGTTTLIEGSTSLDEVHQALMSHNGMASFMAAQVVADLKYADPEKWSDFHTFAASGPGSKRGLNRVYGLYKDGPISEVVFRARLGVLRDSVNAVLKWKEPITAQDVQNCLCEFDKYERARLGEGRPKQLYKPLT